MAAPRAMLEIMIVTLMSIIWTVLSKYLFTHWFQIGLSRRTLFIYIFILDVILYNRSYLHKTVKTVQKSVKDTVGI